MVENSNGSANKPDSCERPLFPHPPWTLGIVLIFGVLSVLAGISNPIWFLLGAPFILVLALFLYSRIVIRRRKKISELTK
jgi:hypothetical protein